jgi:cytochrome oxidase assembly protein ShyY1
VVPFLLTPRWIVLHLVTVAVVAGFTALGWWQLGVYRDSEARQEVRDRPVLPIEELATPGRDLGAATERAVAATGSYLSEGRLLVPARVHDGVLGSYTVAPLRMPDGGVLVALRGWVDEPTDPGARPPRGSVTVTGHLLAPEVATDATAPGADLPDGQIGFIAPDPVAEATGLAKSRLFAGYLLVEDEQPPPAVSPQRLELGVVEPIRDVSPWQNLSYWAQWWVFAGAALVFWASFVRSGLRRRRSQAATDAPREVTIA